MKDGRIQQNDTPLQLYNHPANQFVAGFIGSPSMNFIEGRLVADGDGLRFDEGKISLPLLDEMKEPLAGYVGQELTLGIRPEDIHDPDTMGRGVDTITIEAQVEVVEPMGNEVFLYLTTGISSFVARVDPIHIPEVGHQVKLAVEIGKAHFFSKDAQESLLGGR